MDDCECRKCNTMKTRSFSHIRKGTKGYFLKVFVDHKGRQWSGRTCPDCTNLITKNHNRIKRGSRILQLEKEIQQLQTRLKEAESVIGFYGEMSSWTIDHHSFEDESGDVANGEFAQTIRSDCDKSNYGGKRAREYKQKYKDKE